MKCSGCGEDTGIFGLRDGLCTNCIRAQSGSNQPPQRQSISITVPQPPREPTAEERGADVILTTGETVPGRMVADILDVVAAEEALALNVFKDFANSVRDVFGGKSETIENSLRDVRSSCLKALRTAAAQAGADAVISMRLVYNEVSTGSGTGSGILVVAAYGTAVRLAPPTAN